MARERLTWKAAGMHKKADPYTMNQEHVNNPIEKYKTYDTSEGGEDPDMRRPWEQEGRDETGHPAPKSDAVVPAAPDMSKEAVIAAAKLQDKALKCITIAQRMLPGADQDMIEKQATDLMYLPEKCVIATLQRQAELAAKLAAESGCSEDEKEDASEEPAKKAAGKVEKEEEASPEPEKKPAKKAAEKVEKEEEEEASPEPEKKPAKKAAEKVEKEEEEEASPKPEKKPAKKAAEKVEKEEEEEASPEPEKKPAKKAAEKVEKEEEEEASPKPEKKPAKKAAEEEASEPAEKAEEEEEAPAEENEKEASDSDMLDLIFADEQPKDGIKKLSGMVRKASDETVLSSLWDVPPDISKVF